MAYVLAQSREVEIEEKIELAMAAILGKYILANGCA